MSAIHHRTWTANPTPNRIRASSRIAMMSSTAGSFRLARFLCPSRGKQTLVDRWHRLRVLRHPGPHPGELRGVIGVGAWLAWRAVDKKFLSEIKAGEMSPQVRRTVVAFGRVGGIARGIVFGA